MSRVLVLDSGPLGLLVHSQLSDEVTAFCRWLEACLRHDARVIVPAIIYYEIKRELLRLQQTSSIRRLDQFLAADPDRYLPLTDAALRYAAELWANTRQQGRPTADRHALDVDVLLAAQVLASPSGTAATVVTTNARHLTAFVDAQAWRALWPLPA